MKIETVPISKVLPYPGNPRINDGAAVSKVAASLQEFGWQQPLVVDSDWVLIVGHTRLKAALSLGFEKVPVHRAINLTPDQVRAYRIADNRVGEESDWNKELLALELDELRGADVSFDVLGFDADELAELEAGLVPKAAPEEFGSYGDDIETAHQCPSCGYRWSGKAGGGQDLKAAAE